MSHGELNVKPLEPLCASVILVIVLVILVIVLDCNALLCIGPGPELLM